jgi:phenylalanyl-tRNA synthetase alpha chain
MSKLIFLEDSYQKQVHTKIVSLVTKHDHTDVVLEETVFYPQGGGQPSDIGTIKGKNGTLAVTHCKLVSGEVIHSGTLSGDLTAGDEVTAYIDWEIRYENMRRHSAGHLLHEVILQNIPGLTPVKAEHGPTAFIEYSGGVINPKVAQTLQTQTNMLVAENRKIMCEFVSFEELTKRAAWVPPQLPKHKPLRIVTIEGFPAMADGGTQVRATGEIGDIRVSRIAETQGHSRVYYEITQPLENVQNDTPKQAPQVEQNQTPITLDQYKSSLDDMMSEYGQAMAGTVTVEDVNTQDLRFFGTSGMGTATISEIKNLPIIDRKTAGILTNLAKVERAQIKQNEIEKKQKILEEQWFDTSLPGVGPAVGHLHIVSQAITEITGIFERIGFTRVRHPEIDWDYYAFESLNMPASHPARDEWETFFIQSQKSKIKNQKFAKIVLTPHTSNGQVREMEKKYLPIRMINIAKCYRRQSDISHVPMFHQFEGLYVDKNVSIGHLKGVLEYFVKAFFGPDRHARIRPYHFQFTEPSFEIDISCGVCQGSGKLAGGAVCRLCKQGWLELGGAGMVHPVVLTHGGIDPEKYSGFAFGWGVERTSMMKSGTKLDDIRLLYGNDVRFLEQF